MIPGEYFLQPGAITCNAGRRTATLTAVNTGDRPIQIGSHFHFFEANPQLAFDRALALGMRLNIAAGTAVRFEPGEEKDVTLVEYGGGRRTMGFNNLVDGDPTEPGRRAASLQKAAALHFKNVPSS